MKSSLSQRQGMPLRYHVLIVLCLFGMAALMVIAATGFADMAKAQGARSWDIASLNSVVRITAGEGMGSGVIVGAQKTKHGYRVTIVTNNHVVERLCKLVGSPEFRHEECAKPRIESTAGDGDGLLIKRDPAHDLALIIVELKTKPSIALISLRKLYAFERVIAIGCGLGAPPFPTEGMISVARLSDGVRFFILHSAAIIFGNSGGGLFTYNEKTHRNELVGINDAIMDSGQGPVPHMALAIPADVVVEFLGAAV